MTMIKAGGKCYSATNPFRILSLDGGGIYGLCTAIMLRKLAERDPEFLRGDSVSLFVGTSAGAINALILAQYENPRDCVLSGELESVWTDAGIYSNTLDPFSAYLSLFGITAFLGSQDLLVFLKNRFGDKTLGDLHHRVLIDTFDWSGGETPSGEDTTWRPKLFDNFIEDGSDRHRRIVDIAYGAGSPPGLRAIRNGLGDGGIFAPNPTMSGLAKAVQHLSTPERGEDEHALADFICVVDAFMGIAAVREAYLEEWQALKRSDADGEEVWRAGTVNMLNSLRAVLPTTLNEPGLAASVTQIREHIDDLADTCQTRSELSSSAVGGVQRLVQAFALELDLVKSAAACVSVDDALSAELGSLGTLLQELDRPEFSEERIELFRVLATGALRLYHEFRPQAPEVLRRLKLFSVGICTTKPYYWLKSFNLGPVLFYASIPTNLLLHNLYPPIYQIMLQAPSGNTDLQAKQILGDSFYRLDPPLVGPPHSPPALVATALARFTPWRDWLAQTVYSSAQSPQADAAVASAARFLQSHNWRGVRFFCDTH